MKLRKSASAGCLTASAQRFLTQNFWAVSWRKEVQGPLERGLATSLITLYVATGLSFSALAIYMVRQEHLSPAEYGLGASVAAILGLVAGPVVGAFADRVNGFILYAVLVWTVAGATICLILAPPLVALGLLSILVMCARGSAAVMGALIGKAVSPDRRLRFRAIVRALSNSAMIVGLGLGAAVLAVGSRVAFDVSFSMEGTTLVAVGGLVWRVRRLAGPAQDEPTAGPVEKKNVAKAQSGILRDQRVVTLALLNGLFCLSEPMLTIAMPLWVAARLSVPLWIASVALVVNTIGVVVLQVPVARRITTSRHAAQSAQAGAVLFAIAAVMFPVTSELSHLAGLAGALGAVIVLALVLVCGDVLYSVGSTALMYELVPQRSYGKSQGILGMGFDIASLSAPALFGWTAGSGGPLGWYLLCVLFAAGALPIRWIYKQNVSAPTPEQARGSSSAPWWRRRVSMN